MGYRDASLYRAEALRYAEGDHGGGRVLRLSRSWIDATYWLLVVGVIASLVFCTLADVGEYARGPATVRIGGRATVTSPGAGVIAAVEVAPGDRVAAGDVLVRLQDDADRSALASLELEYRTALAQLLREPSAAATRERIATLVRERDLALARVAAHEIRAVQSGVVTDVRIRVGQAVAAGDAIATLEQPGGGATLVAFLPGELRPMLAPGARGELELDGFARRFVEVTIDEIGSEVIGAAEVARFLGPERADAVQVAGPVVVVRARLDERAIEVDGREYAVFDGMVGRLELRVRSKNILVTVVPGLRELAERWQR